MRISDWSSDVCSSDLQRSVFLAGLHSPFGMALIGDSLYVADTDAVLHFPYERDATAITAPGAKLIDLPAGTINHHWTKNIIASPDGATLYATVGSNSNVGENGIPAEEGRAAIWRIDVATGAHRVFDIERASCRERVCQYV